MLGEKEGLLGVRGVSALPLLLLALWRHGEVLGSRTAWGARQPLDGGTDGSYLSPLLSLELRRELLEAGEGLAPTEGLLGVTWGGRQR